MNELIEIGGHQFTRTILYKVCGFTTSDTQSTLAATTLLARSIASIFQVSSDSKNCIRKLKKYLLGKKELETKRRQGKMLNRSMYHKFKVMA
jgi:hypothetical protein